MKATAKKTYRNGVYRNSGYSEAGASLSKRALKGFLATSSSAVEDIDFNNRTLRERSRILYMASPVGAAAINTARTKIVGSGIHLKSVVNKSLLNLSDEEALMWQRKVQSEWKLWADKKYCDSHGINNFYELQQVVLKSWLMSGDVFCVIQRDNPTPLNPYSLKLHIIEADRVSTPSTMTNISGQVLTEGVNSENGNLIHDGVEVNAMGKVVAYHICNSHPTSYVGDVKWTRVEVEGKNTGLPNILHIMSTERPEQYRGVSLLAPVIETLLQLRRYTESELMAALVQSFLTAWIYTEDPSNNLFNEVDEDEVSDNDNEYELGPGIVNYLKPGEKVQLGNPNIPTAGFDQFMRMIIQLIGSALEIPYDVLMKEFNSSYSAAKGALEEAWEVFKMRRSWFIADFCQPVYEIWLSEAVALGRINAPGFFTNPLIRDAWCGARWDGPAQTHLDPLKEANAAKIQVENAWKSNEQITRELYGGDWYSNIESIKEEQSLIPKEKEIKEE